MMMFAHWELTAQIATAVLGAVSAAFAYFAKTHAKTAKEKAHQIEDAVNHRHSYDGTPPRLYDLALENRRRLTDAEFADVAQQEQLDRLEAGLDSHVKWEEGDDGKYGEVLAELRRLMELIQRPQP